MRISAKSARSLSLVACLVWAISSWSHAASAAARTPFPPGFYFGTSIAGFQVEMGCPSLVRERCEDRGSDWYAFITSPWTLRDPGLYLSQDPPTSGPGFYELYRDDLQRARTLLGGNALRLSVEWSRLFPQPTFALDGYEAMHAAAAPEALRYYHDLFQTTRAQGFEPFVTINHYTLPLWLHDGVGCHRDFARCELRGWDDQRIVPEIAKFAAFVAREFGREVDYWSTLNGPFASVILSGYLTPSSSRSNPPGVYHQEAAAHRAMHNMVEAHARIYDAVHAEDRWSAVAGQAPASVGMSSSLSAIVPASGEPADVAAAQRMRYLINEMFLNAVVNGDLDEAWDGHPQHHDELAHRMDYLGINYYFRWPVAAGSTPLFAPDAALPDLASLDANADGLYDIIAQTAAYQLPIYITETGYNATTHPALAGQWLQRTLDATRRALAAGYDVRGYMYWSLLDNYEWNQGSHVHFGLFGVDAADPAKTRHPRPAAAVFHEFSTSRLFPPSAL